MGIGAKLLLLLALLFVFGTVARLLETSNVSNSPSPSGEGTSNTVSQTVQPKLAILSSRAYASEGGGYYIVEGQVQNISGESLRNIEAVANWSTRDGTFVTSDSAMVDYDPILPGQVSPFKTMSRANPEMAKYSVEFKSLMGGTVYTDDRRKK